MSSITHERPACHRASQKEPEENNRIRTTSSYGLVGELTTGHVASRLSGEHVITPNRLGRAEPSTFLLPLRQSRVLFLKIRTTVEPPVPSTCLDYLRHEYIQTC